MIVHSNEADNHRLLFKVLELGVKGTSMKHTILFYTSSISMIATVNLTQSLKLPIQLQWLYSIILYCNQFSLFFIQNQNKCITERDVIGYFLLSLPNVTDCKMLLILSDISTISVRLGGEDNYHYNIRAKSAA